MKCHNGCGCGSLFNIQKEGNKNNLEKKDIAFLNGTTIPYTVYKADPNEKDPLRERIDNGEEFGPLNGR